jgi:hypothetical protein
MEKLVSNIVVADDKMDIKLGGQQNRIMINREKMNCLFIGLEDDPTTLFAYPSKWNYCRRSKPPLPPNLEHQVVFCLGTADKYNSCPLIKARQERSFHG